MDETRRTPGTDEIKSIVDLVDALDRLQIQITGTKAQPGLLDRTEAMAEKIGAAGEGISVYVDRLAAAAQLHEQLKALPDELLRPHESAEFRASMQKALLEDAAQILRVSYETALKGACLAAVEKAVAEIQLRIDTTALERSLVTEEAGKVLQGKLDRSTEDITRLNAELDAARKLISGHSISLNKLRDVMSARFADHLAAARKWSLTKVVIGAILGAVLSNLYLTPQIEALLAPETTHKPIY